jgi:hypothetical protein
LVLLGGEPVLHPKLFELCQIARRIVGPERRIDILSNGTIIEPIAQHKQEYLDLNINFFFTSYPFKTKDKEIKDLAPLGVIHNTRVLSK